MMCVTAGDALLLYRDAMSLKEATHSTPLCGPHRIAPALLRDVTEIFAAFRGIRHILQTVPLYILLPYTHRYTFIAKGDQRGQY